MQKPLGQYRVCLADQGQSISSSLALSWFKSKMLCCSDTAAPSAQPSQDVLGAHFRLCRKRRNESLRTWVLRMYVSSTTLVAMEKGDRRVSMGEGHGALAHLVRSPARYRGSTPRRFSPGGR